MSYHAVGGIDPGQLTKAVTTIVTDPALPRIVGYVLELNRLEQKPGGPTIEGIGLSNIERPLKMYVWSRKNKWSVPVAIGVLLGIPFLLGYAIGKR